MRNFDDLFRLKKSKKIKESTKKEVKVCGEECEIYARVVGYYSERKNVNPGKLEEMKMRKSMDLSKFTADV
jgi:anaerobic ribonucleoside-triphosphate reductase